MSSRKETPQPALNAPQDRSVEPAPYEHHIEVEDDQIGLDWDAGRRSVVALTLGERSLGYSILMGERSAYGRVIFDRPIPRIVLEWFAETAKASQDDPR